MKRIIHILIAGSLFSCTVPRKQENHANSQTCSAEIVLKNHPDSYTRLMDALVKSVNIISIDEFIQSDDPVYPLTELRVVFDGNPENLYKIRAANPEIISLHIINP